MAHILPTLGFGLVGNLLGNALGGHKKRDKNAQIDNGQGRPLGTELTPGSTPMPGGVPQRVGAGTKYLTGSQTL